MSGFRLEAKKFFLTFPQNTTAKETALENIKLRLPKYLWVMIAQEVHQDGEKHLHIGIEFCEKLRTRNADFFDCIAGKHGNYQTMKDARGTIKYLRKEDADPLVDGTVPSIDDKKGQKGNAVAAMVSAGSSLKQIFDSEPGYFLSNKRKIEELAGWINQLKYLEAIVPFPGRFFYSSSDLGTAEIVSWLNGNLIPSCPPRPLKSKQLYIQGPASYFKTSLIVLLEKWFRVYWVPMDEEFYDYYDDSNYDLIVFDEFKLQKKLQWLNKFIEGAPVLVRKKGVPGMMKRKNLPVVFLSNYSVFSLLPDDNDRELFESRIQTILLTSPIDTMNILTEAITEPCTPSEPDSPVYSFQVPDIGINDLYCEESL